MMTVKRVSIMAGRDRMTSVLEPLLGVELARERANNIAQVLIFSPEDPVQVARSMLRSIGITALSEVAEEVGRAWHTGVAEMERAS